MRAKKFQCSRCWMNFIDFILNVVGLLFWLNWRAVHTSVIAHPGGSLSSTLKAANSPRPRWFYLGLLIGLLLVRAFFYWQIGPALPWNPRLDLGFTTLTFRSDFFGQILSYSFLSFAAALWVLYLWIVLLACINANASEEDSIHRFFQLHLGFVKSWPTALKLAAPLGVGSPGTELEFAL